ncbi:MAG: hypothetical protein M1838_004492 [Thelocarpon superellum]|nr:MAG: hypothetical protein M1838_004492 [Thelocarpon superellum]
MMHALSPQAVAFKPAPLRIPKHKQERTNDSPSRSVGVHGPVQTSRDDVYNSPSYASPRQRAFNKHRKSSFHEQGGRVIDAARKSLRRMSLALGPHAMRSPSVIVEHRERDSYSWKDLPDPPYHVLSIGARLRILALVCMAGSTLSLSYSMFSPAQTLIAKTLKVKLTVLNLSLSAHTVASGIAPIFWAPLADSLGRRQILIIALLVSSLANLGLATATNTVGALVGFRALEGLGTASIEAIALGIVADIFPASDRGAYLGIAYAFAEVVATFGPLLGGYLAQTHGFHSIFFFILFFGAITNVLLFIFLPETHRPIAGNGSVKLVGIAYRPPAYDLHLVAEPDCPMGETTKNRPRRERVTWRTFLVPFRFFFEIDVFVTVIFVSVIFMCVLLIASISSPVLAMRFHLTPTQIGMTSIPSGITTIIAASVIGRIMDRDFRREETLYKFVQNLPPNFTVNRETLPNSFPLEHARLQQLGWLLGPFIFCIVIFGYVIGQKSLTLYIAIHCALQFTTVGVAILTTTLIIDLYPGKTASAIAVQGVVRSAFGAVGSGIGQPLLEKLGPERLFMLLGGVIAAALPLLFIERRWGPVWRGRRSDRLTAAASGSPVGS